MIFSWVKISLNWFCQSLFNKFAHIEDKWVGVFVWPNPREMQIDLNIQWICCPLN